MEYFVEKNSIVREIWSKGDTILFIFAGSAAEFALNKAVDWLYFTGRLPADPLGRLFSTVSYARRIIFAEKAEALKAIDQITAIHQVVEKNRGSQIPDWAYRDVLFMLIDYSIRAFELLERKLTVQEKEDTFQSFYRLGARMGIRGLPLNYADWRLMRAQHLENNLVCSGFSVDLFMQYKKQLGNFRFQVLKQGQYEVVPERVRELLSMRNSLLLSPMVPMYKIARSLGVHRLIKDLMLPQEYKKQIADLDMVD